MRGGMPARWLTFLKARPYTISVAFIAVFFVLMWAWGRERPFTVDQVSGDVMGILSAHRVVPEPRFRRLRMTIRRDVDINGVPAEVTVERTEIHMRQGIAERRERWFHENPISPIWESRSFTLGGFVSL